MESHQQGPRLPGGPVARRISILDGSAHRCSGHRIVDYSFRPELTEPERSAGWAIYDPDTGGHLILGMTVKKAVLQSAPWMAIGVLVISVAWMRRAQLTDAQRRLVRFLSLPAIALVGTFAFAGVFRHDGMSFNQRYLLELVPLAAAVLAVGVDGLSMRYPQLLLGVALGGVATAMALMWGPVSSGPDGLVSDSRQLLILKVPLGLALLSAVTWVLVQTRRLRSVALALMSGFLSRMESVGPRDGGPHGLVPIAPAKHGDDRVTGARDS